MLQYYPFFWGDYIQKTAHLSQTQHGAYMLFLRHLYGTGQPIEDRQKYRISQAFTDEEKEAADYVLKNFFKECLRDSLKIWRNEKCEEVIEKANDLHAKKVAGGSAGGLKRAENQKNNSSTPLSTPLENTKDSFKDASSNPKPKTYNQNPKNQNLKSPLTPQNVNNSVDKSEKGDFKNSFKGEKRIIDSVDGLMIELGDKGLEKAKKAAKHLYIYDLAKTYVEGISERGMPDDWTGAFIGYVKKCAEKKQF